MYVYINFDTTGTTTLRPGLVATVRTLAAMQRDRKKQQAMAQAYNEDQTGQNTTVPPAVDEPRV